MPLYLFAIFFSILLTRLSLLTPPAALFSAPSLPLATPSRSTFLPLFLLRPLPSLHFVPTCGSSPIVSSYLASDAPSWLTAKVPITICTFLTFFSSFFFYLFPFVADTSMHNLFRLHVFSVFITPPFNFPLRFAISLLVFTKLSAQSPNAIYHLAPLLLFLFTFPYQLLTSLSVSPFHRSSLLALLSFLPFLLRHCACVTFILFLIPHSLAPCSSSRLPSISRTPLHSPFIPPRLQSYNSFSLHCPPPYIASLANSRLTHLPPSFSSNSQSYLLRSLQLHLKIRIILLITKHLNLK